MYRPKRLATIAVLLATIAVLTFLTIGIVLWPRSPRISREQCQSIGAGMSPNEVFAILGPPGDYTTGPVDTPAPTLSRPTHNPMTGELMPVFEHIKGQWETDTGTAILVCDSSGRSLVCLYYTCNRKDQSPIENALWRVKRQWRRLFP
jgi:hypothetical protein